MPGSRFLPFALPRRVIVKASGRGGRGAEKGHGLEQSPDERGESAPFNED